MIFALYKDKQYLWIEHQNNKNYLLNYQNPKGVSRTLLTSIRMPKFPLEDLNSSMHQPLVSEQDLEDATNEVQEQVDDSIPIFDGTNPIDPNDLINNAI